MQTSLAPKVTSQQELIVTALSVRVPHMGTDQEREAFAARLNEICDDMKLPPKGDGRQGALATKFGVSQKGARKWLEAEAMPQTQKTIEMAKWANVSLEWLMSGRGRKQLDDPARPAITSEQIARVLQVMQDLAPYEQEIIASQAEALGLTFKNKPTQPQVKRPDEAA